MSLAKCYDVVSKNCKIAETTAYRRRGSLIVY